MGDAASADGTSDAAKGTAAAVAAGGTRAAELSPATFVLRAAMARQREVFPGAPLAAAVAEVEEMPVEGLPADGNASTKMRASPRTILTS